MNNLKIKQNTITENVTSAIIEKLYEITKSNDYSYHSDDLTGNLQVSKAYGDSVSYLELKFPDLHINVTGSTYIRFQDPEALRIFANWWGDGTGCTLEDTRSHTILDFTGNDSITGRTPFINNTTITSLNELGLMTTVVEIKSLRFEKATNLTSIDLSNILYIGWLSFIQSGLLGVLNLPNLIGFRTNNNSLTPSRAGNAFSGTELTEVNFNPDCFVYLQNSTFEGCVNLTKVTGLANAYGVSMSFGINIIPDSFFTGCTSLQSVDFNYSNIYGYGAGCFNNCSNLETTIDLTNALYIWRSAFYNCKKITFTGSLSNLISIGSRSFYNCSKQLPDNIDLSNTTINSGTDSAEMFLGANCDKVILFDMTPITSATSMFKNSTVSEITETNIIKVFGNMFLECTNLTKINNLHVIQMPSTVGDNLFYNCTLLKTITYPYFTGTIGVNAFRNCSNLEGALYFVGECTIRGNSYGCNFNGCSKLEKIVFEHLPNISSGNSNLLNNSGFGGCSSLKIIDLGDSIEYIRPYNFINCNSLRAVIMRIATPPIARTEANNFSITEMFGNTTVNVYVPDEAVDTYKSTLPYSNFTDHIFPISEFDEESVMAS